MKLKKNAKRIIIILIVIVLLVVSALVVSRLIPKKEEVKEAKVLDTIDDYGYVLKDNKSKAYQSLFKELIKILNSEETDEQAYVSKLSEMFIVDFYSLANKSAKTDVGGVDIVHPDILGNFLENAENTFYKYVESDIYNNRNQKLPEVETVTVEKIETISYTYAETTDENAYSVDVIWTYTDDEFSDYQQKANLIFIHKDNKLYLVELK